MNHAISFSRKTAFPALTLSLVPTSNWQSKFKIDEHRKTSAHNPGKQHPFGIELGSQHTPNRTPPLPLVFNRKSKIENS
jgi:hypothetical protein